MKNIQNIPIIFGVTGHRDIRDEDIPKLYESLKKLFRNYQDNYPHTELIVLDALAEGADMLVAKVAKDLGLTLHAVLPYEKDAYLQSFGNQENREIFEEMKAYASNIVELNSIKSCSAEDCYQRLGEYIADTCNVLIALWDGVDNGKNGGTSAIVKYARQSFKENISDQFDDGVILIITTPRVSNPRVDTDYSIKEDEFGNILHYKHKGKMD